MFGYLCQIYWLNVMLIRKSNCFWECKKYLLYIWRALQPVVYLQFLYQIVHVYFSKCRSYVPPGFTLWCYPCLRQQIIQCNDCWWMRGGKWSWLYQVPSWNFPGWNNEKKSIIQKMYNAIMGCVRTTLLQWKSNIRSPCIVGLYVTINSTK